MGRHYTGLVEIKWREIRHFVTFLEPTLAELVGDRS